MYLYSMMNKGNIDEKMLSERKKMLADELAIWENYLKGDYICGSNFTMADVVVFPTLAFLVRGSLNLEHRPNMQRYYSKLSQRPSILGSWPPHFKVTPPNKVFENV